MGFKSYILPLAASLSLITMLALDAANYEDPKEIASDSDKREVARAGGRGGTRVGGGAKAEGNRAATGGAYSRTPTMSRADRMNVNRASSQVSRNPVNPVGPTLHQPAIQRGNDGAGQRLIGPGVQRQSQSRADFQTQARQQINQANSVRTNPAQVNQNFRNSYANVRRENIQHANNVRGNLRNTRPLYNNYFNDNFFNKYDYHPNWYTPGYNAWAASNWNNVSSWVDSGWSTPLYYDNLGVASQVPTEYVIGGAVAQPVQGDWLPLGIFAASQNTEDASYTNMFVQIVIDRAGILSGTYYNAATDKMHPLDGFLDKESQQAVWRVSDNINSPVMTAGIYNLTQDIAEVKVRYSNGNEQYWTFVRLNQ